MRLLYCPLPVSKYPQRPQGVPPAISAYRLHVEERRSRNPLLHGPTAIRTAAVFKQCDWVFEPWVADFRAVTQVVQPAKHQVVPMGRKCQMGEPLLDDLASSIRTVHLMHQHEL